MSRPENDADFVRHEPCPSCKSSNNLARYSDGHGFCFGCKHYEHGDGTASTHTNKKEKRLASLINGGEYRDLTKRHISEETCKHWSYQCGKHNDRPVQIANYFDADGAVIAQKIRSANKEFTFVGEPKKALPLYGQWLWRDSGKMIVITEGEIDALSVSHLQGNKWPVVSVPNGAAGAAKSVSKAIEWLEKFEKVVFMFDMDEPGREAAKECALLLSPGKAFIASLPLKDANECLVNGKGAAVIDAIWSAKAFRPDGLISIDEIIELAQKPVEIGLPWCFPTLTELTYGRRMGEIYGFGAGTGVGKTDLFTQQMEFDINTLNMSVGVIYLEQGVVETAKRIAGKAASRRFHVPDDGWTQKELEKSLAALKGKVILYDSFGESDWDIVKAKIRYMATANNTKLFYLDHLTAMADTSNEKESIEQIMKEMAGLAKALNIIIHFVSHLSTPEGKPHEEGGRVMIKHFKGSRSIGFWSYFMFGLERDQQHKDESRRQITTFRVLKDRNTGQATGKVFGLGYEASTGRLYERELPSDDSPSFRDESGDEPF